MTFSQKLDQWYTDYGRTLPWRGISDPYRIWLSEVILQQTRIEQGRDYYMRFVESFPTVADLAAASEEQVLRLWQGLGYYSRARNLLVAARQVMEEYDGSFPDTYENILRLKGVGRYTAAAIASFAFRLPYPVIDGNVYRFISRFYGITIPIGTPAAYNEFESLLLKKIDRKRPDRFNAALMDFGSLQCRPQPYCGACLFAAQCEACRTGRVELLPIKQFRVRTIARYFNYLDLRWWEDGCEWTVVEKRTGRDIWRGLYQLPLYESDCALDGDALQMAIVGFARDAFGLGELCFEERFRTTHQLTHRILHALFLRAELASCPAKIPEKMVAVKCCEIKNIPVSRLIDRYLHLL